VYTTLKFLALKGVPYIYIYIYIYDIRRLRVKAGSMTIHAEVHKLINSIWYKEELPEQEA
jgi:hypothetical protein